MVTNDRSGYLGQLGRGRALVVLRFNGIDQAGRVLVLRSVIGASVEYAAGNFTRRRLNGRPVKLPLALYVVVSGLRAQDLLSP
jgi:hypothetical protein